MRSPIRYESFFIRVKANSLARAVKLADLRDNLRPERMAKLAPETAVHLGRRYRLALEVLEDG